jgi:hypothetical protein
LLLLSPYFISNTPSISGAYGTRSWRAASPLFAFATGLDSHASPSFRVALLTSKNDGSAYQESREFRALLTRAHDAFDYVVVGRPPHNYRFWTPRFSSMLSWLLAGAHC